MFQRRPDIRRHGLACRQQYFVTVYIIIAIFTPFSGFVVEAIGSLFIILKSK